MRTSFFPKLAWSGIRKNSKLYVPYILSCIGMIMMFYILSSLSLSPLISKIKGGRTLITVLRLGQFVVGAFAVLFLFYTNSFLIKKRYKEFGLYNILGMDKKSIRKIVLWETIIIFCICIITGLSLGIAFSKLAELGLLNIIKAEIDYNFYIAPSSIYTSLIVFGAIFLLIMLKSEIQVGKMKPLELLHSDKAGEKPLRANWVAAILGLIILAAAYALAVSIKTPLTALTIFFVAVIMVIIATYILFMSGSVALCKLLQKKKDYYYKKEHFVSVSSMAFRMKRNGAGLASICILATMVLVMISSSSSLYFGMEDSLKARFPLENEMLLKLDGMDHSGDEYIGQIKDAYSAVFDEMGVKPDKVSEYRYAESTFLVTKNGLEYDPSPYIGGEMLNYDSLRMFYFMSAEDYNSAMGTNISLEKDQAMVYELRCTFDNDSIAFGDVELKVVGKLDDFVNIPDANTMIVPSVFVLINDYDVINVKLANYDGDPIFSLCYYYGFDLPGSEHDAEAMNKLSKALIGIDFLFENGGFMTSSSCYELEKDDFISTYGGLFFIGIILSIVFIFAAALIIYYKQITEGIEDQARFDIMKKVGMTNEDIKKSINSQVVTVFFAPLLFAGLHLAFAFPLVWKMLMMFNLYNLKFVILVTVIAFLLFSLFYVVIYRITARAYYNIVSNSSKERRVY